MDAAVRHLKINFVPERAVAASWALLLHGLVAAVIFASVTQRITPPEALGGFEVVDLSSYGAAQSEYKKEEPAPPEPEKIIEEKVVEPQAKEPVPEPIEEPLAEPLIKKVSEKPRPVVRKNKAVHQARPKSKPTPPVEKKIAKVQPVKKEIIKKQPSSVPVVQNKITAATPGEAAYIPPNGKTAYLRNPKPAYPKMARRRGLEGVVILSVSVSSQGRVRALTLKKSSGHKLLDQAAHKAVKRWRFTPATRGGINVGAKVDVPIRFSLNHIKKGAS